MNDCEALKYLRARSSDDGKYGLFASTTFSFLVEIHKNDIPEGKITALKSIHDYFLDAHGISLVDLLCERGKNCSACVALVQALTR